MATKMKKKVSPMTKEREEIHARIKDQKERSYEYFAKNYDRFWECQTFIYASAMNSDEIASANRLGRPTLESNCLEPYIGRQVGEMYKQLPDPLVEPKIPNDVSKAAQSEVVENHIRHQFDKANNIRLDSFKYAASGGFYVFKVVPDYLSPKTLHQGIFIKRVKNVTKCGFDPMAIESDKSDGEYSWEDVPMELSDFKSKYPGVDIDEANFESRGDEWFYCIGEGDQKKKIVVVCDFYEKKYEEKKMYLVSNPLHPDSQPTYSEEKYKEMVEKLKKLGKTEGEIPKILKKETRRVLVDIIKYEFNGDRILKEEETEWEYLPHIFCDGNSAEMEDEQMCRPLVYHAMDIQKAKNLTFQTILNDIENKEQTKTYLPVAGLPTQGQYLDSWLNTQTTHAARFYNHRDQNGNEIPPPTPTNATMLDATMIGFYESLEKSIQYSLGSFDAQQGIQQQDMSGLAIDKGARQSNNSMMPYIINYCRAWAQAARICVSLMPKYYTTMRSIPVMDRKGQKSYIVINDSQTNPLYKIEYEEDDMNVDVKMDLNFDAQKAVALQNINTLMKSSPLWEQFFSQEGAHFVIDNMTFRDSAKVKEEFEKFQQKKIQEQAIAMKMQALNNPEALKKQIAEMEMQSKDKDRKVELIKTLADIKIESRKADVEEEMAQAKILESQAKIVTSALSTMAENKRSQAETAIALDKHAYEKIESERNHAHKRQESDRVHALDLVDRILEQKNLKEERSNDQKEIETQET